MHYKIIPDVLTPQELAVIYNNVLGPDFPWYHLANDTVDGYGKPFMSHTLMHRHSSNGPEPGTVNSDAFDFFKEIFKRIVPNYKTILRANLNLTFHSEGDYGNPHVDHVLPHHVALIYLNPSCAGTVLFNDDGTVLETIPHQDNAAVLFDGSIKHAQQTPGVGEARLVAVFNYI